MPPPIATPTDAAASAGIVNDIALQRNRSFGTISPDRGKLGVEEKLGPHVEAHQAADRYGRACIVASAHPDAAGSREPSERRTQHSVLIL
jgi:hypothetical protein